MKKYLAILLVFALLVGSMVCFAEEFDVENTKDAQKESPMLLTHEAITISEADVADEVELTDIGKIDLSTESLRMTQSYDEEVELIENSHSDIAIDEAHFPDSNFRAFVLEKVDTNGDGYLSDYESMIVTELSFGDYGDVESVYDVTGLEFFEQLELLVIRGCNINKLDVSNNKQLKELICDSNGIEELDVSKCKYLNYLDCSFNGLKILKLNRYLVYLSCSGNKLTELDVSKNANLTELYVYDNKLVSLKTKNCKLLEYIGCADNVLNTLDLRTNTGLIEVECYGNKLSSLKMGKNTKLKKLYCFENELKTLDVSLCTKLNELNCRNNKLRKLTLGKKTVLSDLDCSHNKLKELDIAKCTVLKGELTPVIVEYDKKNKTVSWGGYHYEDTGRERGKGHIEIDKATTLKSGKTILYKSGTPKTIKFKKGSATLKKGASVNLGKYITMSPAGVASVCILSSSDKKVVKVDNSGYAYGLKKGTATVTVKTKNGKKAKIKITVK